MSRRRRLAALAHLAPPPPVVRRIEPIQRQPLPVLPGVTLLDRALWNQYAADRWVKVTRDASGREIAWDPIPERRGAQVWATDTYDDTLWFDPSENPFFYYANFCGMYVAGAPAVPMGKNATIPGADTGLMWTPHLDRYPIEWQHRGLTGACERGLNTWCVSLGHTMGEMGRTREETRELCRLIRSYGLKVDLWCIGGAPPYAQKDGEWERDYRVVFADLVKFLLDAGVVDAGCIGWQLNQSNSPYGLRTIIEGLSEIFRPLPIGTHWQNDACAWFGADQNGDSRLPDRRAFYRFVREQGHRWLHGQWNTEAPIDYVQSKIVDVLNALAEVAPDLDLTGYEYKAQAQFPQGGPEIETDEDHGDLEGYLLLCTRARKPLGGLGGGGRLPGGAPVWRRAA